MNRLRKPIEEEELEKRLIVERKPRKEKKEIPDNYLTLYFRRNFTAEKATKALPFVLFLALLGMLYIGNNHMAERNIRAIDTTTRRVNELSYEYKATKAELAHNSTLTEVAKKVDSLGLKEAIAPPQKITVEEVEK
jgi:hypothetical protein